jgi:hypothetical protein
MIAVSQVPTFDCYATLHRHPSRLDRVVLVAGRVLQGLFGGIHGEPPLALPSGSTAGIEGQGRVRVRPPQVRPPSSAYGIEGHGHILLVNSKESRRYNESNELAVLADQDIVDLANLDIGGIIDVLLLEVGDGHRVLRNHSQSLRPYRAANSRRRGLLRVGRAGYGRGNCGSNGQCVHLLLLH